MKRILLVAVTLLVFAGGCRRDPVIDKNAIKKPEEQGKKPQRKEYASDEERIQGSWRALKSEMNGRALGVNAVWTFKDDKATLQEGFGSSTTNSEGTFTLDTKSQPRTLDLVMEDGKYQCVYQFEEDELSVCFDEAGGRPMELSSKGSPTRVLHRFKRASP